MQPTFNPWIGYFDMMDKVDMFVFYDDVQLEKRSWQTRNKIKSSQGELYLTVPIRKTKHRDELLINDAFIQNDENWKHKHLQSFIKFYRKSCCFDDVFNFLESLYNKNHDKLVNFNVDLIEGISRKVGIQTPTIRAGRLENITGKKDERLVHICNNLGCNVYLSPQGSSKYIEKNHPGGEFNSNNITLLYHNFNHPTYKQLYGDFISHVGIIDLLFNVGFKNALETIRSGRCQDYSSKSLREIQGL